MNRYYIQEGLNKWLIQDRETGKTVMKRDTKDEVETLIDKMNSKQKKD